ncbi:MAG: hypothetical protein WBD81_05930 [Collimonas pratensis]|uniref:hypothetical protein n=1 Tax=Collimonas pratensis TaxID=279113 RepID=UPI003C764132
MNSASTTCQTVTALPGPSLAVSARAQRVSAGVLQTLRLAAAWWQQRLQTPPATPLIRLHDLNDHILRDIGYLDAARPCQDQRQRQEY